MISAVVSTAISILMLGVIPTYAVLKGIEQMLPPKEIPIEIVNFREWSGGVVR